jgi:hypothetical protein
MKVTALRSYLRFLSVIFGLVILDIGDLFRENYFRLLLSLSFFFSFEYYELIGCDTEKPEVDMEYQELDEK